MSSLAIAIATAIAITIASCVLVAPLRGEAEQIAPTDACINLLDNQHSYDEVRLGIDTEHYKMIQINLNMFKENIYDTRYICPEQNQGQDSPKNCFQIALKMTVSVCPIHTNTNTNNMGLERTYIFYTHEGAKMTLLEIVHCGTAVKQAKLHYSSLFKFQNLLLFRPYGSPEVAKFEHVPQHVIAWLRSHVPASLSVRRGYISTNMDLSLESILYGENASRYEPSVSVETMESVSKASSMVFPAILIYSAAQKVPQTGPFYYWDSAKDSFIDLKHCIEIGKMSIESMSSNEYFDCVNHVPYYKYDTQLEHPINLVSSNANPHKEMPLIKDTGYRFNLNVLIDHELVMSLDYRTCEMRLYFEMDPFESPRPNDAEDSDDVHSHYGIIYARKSDKTVLLNSWINFREILGLCSNVYTYTGQFQYLVNNELPEVMQNVIRLSSMNVADYTETIMIKSGIGRESYTVYIKGDKATMRMTYLISSSTKIHITGEIQYTKDTLIEVPGEPVVFRIDQTVLDHTSLPQKNLYNIFVNNEPLCHVLESRNKHMAWFPYAELTANGKYSVLVKKS